MAGRVFSEADFADEESPKPSGRVFNEADFADAPAPAPAAPAPAPATPAAPRAGAAAIAVPASSATKRAVDDAGTRGTGGEKQTGRFEAWLLGAAKSSGLSGLIREGAAHGAFSPPGPVEGLHRFLPPDVVRRMDDAKYERAAEERPAYFGSGAAMGGAAPMMALGPAGAGLRGAAMLAGKGAAISGAQALGRGGDAADVGGAMLTGAAFPVLAAKAPLAATAAGFGMGARDIATAPDEASRYEAGTGMLMDVLSRGATRAGAREKAAEHQGKAKIAAADERRMVASEAEKEGFKRAGEMEQGVAAVEADRARSVDATRKLNAELTAAEAAAGRRQKQEFSRQAQDAGDDLRQTNDAQTAAYQDAVARQRDADRAAARAERIAALDDEASFIKQTQDYKAASAEHAKLVEEARRLGKEGEEVRRSELALMDRAAALAKAHADEGARLEKVIRDGEAGQENMDARVKGAFAKQFADAQAWIAGAREIERITGKPLPEESRNRIASLAEFIQRTRVANMDAPEGAPYKTPVQKLELQRDNPQAARDEWIRENAGGADIDAAEAALAQRKAQGTPDFTAQAKEALAAEAKAKADRDNIVPPALQEWLARNPGWEFVNGKLVPATALPPAPVAPDSSARRLAQIEQQKAKLSAPQPTSPTPPDQFALKSALRNLRKNVRKFQPTPFDRDTFVRNREGTVPTLRDPIDTYTGSEVVKDGQAVPATEADASKAFIDRRLEEARARALQNVRDTIDRGQHAGKSVSEVRDAEHARSVREAMTQGTKGGFFGGAAGAGVGLASGAGALPLAALGALGFGAYNAFKRKPSDPSQMPTLKDFVATDVGNAAQGNQSTYTKPSEARIVYEALADADRPKVALDPDTARRVIGATGAQMSDDAVADALRDPRFVEYVRKIAQRLAQQGAGRLTPGVSP